VLYDYSKQILQTYEGLHSKLQEIKEIISGNIRVATNLQHRVARAASVFEEISQELPDGECARRVPAGEPGLRRYVIG
jgi:hypothetical protein